MTASWYFDFVSPFAYLQWRSIRKLAARHPFEFRPVLLAGLLDHYGQKGPAEIEAKRQFTYRFVQWRAGRSGTPLRFPPRHPFNSLAALRLCIAAGNSAEAIDDIFRHLWRDGKAGDTPETLAGVAGVADVTTAIAAPDVKAALRRNFDAAIADGVFGVPSIVSKGVVFWGGDATAMFEDFLEEPALFSSAEMRRLETLPVGAARKFAGASPPTFLEEPDVR